MRTIKRAVLVIFMVAIFISMFSLFETKVYAATSTYSSLDAIPEDLNTLQTLISGSISAVQVNGVWYYQFTRSGYNSIRIKASAFATTSHSNPYLNADNSVLNSTINGSGSRTTQRINYGVSGVKKQYSGYEKYESSIWRMSFDLNGATPNEIILTEKLTHCVKFTYSSKIPATVSLNLNKKAMSGYITPSSSSDYIFALRRTTTINDVVPKIRLNVTNTGNYGVFISRYMLVGVGNASASTDVNALMTVGFKTAALAKNVATGDILATMSSLYSLLHSSSKLGGNSSKFGYYSWRNITINKYVYKTELKSPIKLSKAGDYIQYSLKLANVNQTTDRGTAQLCVNFSY